MAGGVRENLSCREPAAPCAATNLTFRATGQTIEPRTAKTTAKVIPYEFNVKKNLHETGPRIGYLGHVPSPNEDRPDPDTLLAKVKQQESAARRGKLRIYFGASAGVGKTYAMLVAAGKLHSEGCMVLVGVVETHGRAETAALLEGLPILPPKVVSYRGTTLNAFDLDAAYTLPRLSRTGTEH